MNSEFNKEQALGRAARLCSGSEHCASQVREKLLAWGASGAEADDIIAYLTREKYIDHMRFARAYCHDKFCYNHWGRTKIRQMLRHLRLTDEEIDEGMTAIPEDTYLQTLGEVLRAKDRTLRDDNPYQRKGKLVRHLLSRGFEMELVIDAVDDYLKLG